MHGRLILEGFRVKLTLLSERLSVFDFCVRVLCEFGSFEATSDLRFEMICDTLTVIF